MQAYFIAGVMFYMIMTFGSFIYKP